MRFKSIAVSALMTTWGFALPLYAIERRIQNTFAHAFSVAQSNWQSFSSKGGKFTVQMPGVPQQQTATTTSIIGNPNNWNGAKFSNGSEVYAVAYADLSFDVIRYGK